MDTVLINVLCSALDAVIVLIFLSNFFEKNKLGWLEAVSFFIISFLGIMANSDVAGNMFWTLMITVYYSLYAVLISNESKIKAVVTGVMFSLLNGVVSFVLFFVTAILTQKKLNEVRILFSGTEGIFLVLISKLVIFLGILIFLRLTKKKTLTCLKRSEWLIIGLLLLIVFFIQVILFYTVFILEIPDAVIRIYGLCAVFLMVFAGGIIGIIVRMNKNNGEQMEYQQKMALYEAQQKVLAGFQKEYNSIRYVKHDLRQYFGSAIHFLERGENEEALEYLRTVSKTKVEQLLPMINVNNEVVNATLNSKLLFGKSRGIYFTLGFGGTWYFGKDKEADVDVGIILANLLDNAILAAEHTEEKEVSIKSVDHGGFLRIIIKNSFSEQYERNKKSSNEHGWGLASVCNLVEKYGGLICPEEKDNYHTVVLALKNQLPE